MKNLIYFCILTLFLFSPFSFAKKRVYRLTIAHKVVNITGKEVKHALSINDSIPAPTLNFVEGDEAVIHITNNTKEPTTIHWHGLLVPWDMDGPSFTNNKLIQSGESFTFRFPIKQTGTYWYHSHTNLQEQRGLYGAIVIKEKNPQNSFRHDLVAVLSDWTDEKPKQVLANIKKTGEYYSFKKKFFPSLIDSIIQSSFKDYLKGHWTRMGAMDLSDIGYDAFLINGKKTQTLKRVRPGDKVRLRVINAGASTHFYLNLGKNKNFQIISKDGMGVQPVTVNEILIGMGETYDLVIRVPKKQDGGLEFRATASDITGYGSLIFGMDHHYESVPNRPKINPYKMDHHSMPMMKKGMSHKHRSMSKKKMSHKHHSMPKKKMSHKHHSMPKKKMSHKHHSKMNDPSSLKKILDYEMLKSKFKTNYSKKYPRRSIHLQLNGDMDRYTWYLNGKPFTEDKYIFVRKGEVVQFTFKNGTMMTHPMHLHGHFFRVLNGQGDYSPLFHTIDVKPSEERTIEVYMNEPGLWLFHCHNLYHMKMGMTRILKYEDFKRPKDLIDHELEFSKQFKKDSSAYWKAEVDLFTRYAAVNVEAKRGRYNLEVETELDNNDWETFELETKVKRYWNRYFSLFGGSLYEHQKWKGLIGFSYTLPLLVDLEASARTDKSLEIILEKELALWSQLHLSLEYTFEWRMSDKKKDHDLEIFLDYQVHDRVKLGIYYQTDFESVKFQSGDLCSKVSPLLCSLGVGLRVLF